MKNSLFLFSTYFIFISLVRTTINIKFKKKLFIIYKELISCNFLLFFENNILFYLI